MNFKSGTWICRTIFAFSFLPLAVQAQGMASLVDQIELTHLSAVRDPCDDFWYDKKIELASAIESHQAEIDASLRSQSQSLADGPGSAADSDFRSNPFGPILLQEPPEPAMPTDEWHDDSGLSWSGSYGEYQKLQSFSRPEAWLKLASYVRSLVMDDKRRLKEFYSFGLDESSAPKLNSLIGKLRSCVATHCRALHFSDDEKTLLQSVPVYQFFAQKLTEDSASATFNSNLSKLLLYVESDLNSRFGFALNPAYRVSGHQLILPFRSGDFKLVEERLKAIIEQNWSSPDLAIKVVWTKEPDPVQTAFKFLADANSGDRSITSPERGTITIANHARVSSIVHEVGHALGFPDHYYEVFNPVICGYQTRFNPSDIMSDSGRGGVTKSELNFLREKYLPKSPQF